MSPLERQLRELIDSVDGGDRPRFEDWESLLAFAFQVAAIEREACACVAEGMASHHPITGALYAGPVEDAIRARGGK